MKFRLRLAVTRTFDAEVDIDAPSLELALVAGSALNHDELLLTSTDQGHVEIVSVVPSKRVA